MTKQILAVLHAVNRGFRNSEEVSEETGLNRSAVSSYLTELADDGLVRRGRRRKFKYRKHGPFLNEYLPVDGEQG
jgi:DNA-binding IclR family transcriptional regulator